MNTSTKIPATENESFMQSELLCGVHGSFCLGYGWQVETPLRIIFQCPTACSIAMSLSGARKRPRCKPGGARLASASSFSVGSARR